MNLKLLILIFLMFSFGANSFAQNDTIKVFANNKLIGKKIIKPETEPATITVKKGKYTAVKKLMLCVTSEKKENSIFKRSLDIEANDSALMVVPELISRPGCYIFNVTKLRTALGRSKDIEIYCASDPRDPRMKVMSSRKLLVKIHFE